MSVSRVIASLILPAATFAAPSVSGADQGKGVAIKIQIGGHLLTQDTSIVSDLPGSSEDSGGVLGSFVVLGKDGSRFPYGVCMDIEGNAVKPGPEFPAVGVQTFGIATIRLMGLMEIRLRGPEQEPPESWQPYVSIGAGWNFHSPGTKITWLEPPAGAPLDLEMDGAPAVRVGLGFHRKATDRGLFVNLEGGWNRDTGDFRLRVAEEPDRTGSFDLSSAYLLFGITLRPRATFH